MSLRQEIGQLLHVGGIIGGLGESQQRVMATIAEGAVGGVYLGYPHFRDPAHARRVTAQLRRLSPEPFFIAIDFETGPGYNCVEGCAHFPYFAGLGFIDDPEISRKAAEVTARQALAMGINWLYSPCVDVVLRADNPIDIRSFGENTDKVSRMSRAFLEGCRQTGIFATAKHFPGTGNTCVDSHVGFATDTGDLATWERHTLPAFVAAIEAGAPAIMTGHVSAPFLDPSGTPATFSRTILHDVLRERLGFRGIIASDSLCMGGAAVGSSLGERCVRALEAGCDVLLTPFGEEIFSAFDQAMRGNPRLRRRLDESLQRMADARRKLGALPQGSITAEDNSFALEVGRRAAQVLKGGEMLPLKPGEFACLIQWRNAESIHFPREPIVLSQLQHGIRCHDSSVPSVALSRGCPPSEHPEILRAIGDRKVVILGAIAKKDIGDSREEWLLAGTGGGGLVHTLAAAGKRVVLVLLGSPRAAINLPEAHAVICTGGDTAGCVEGALRKLFGDRDIALTDTAV